uniref:Uncharacterized protein n=1 Tax=Anguilla anguilla TaxID=7936 RepID=A0A0E9VIA7_ANGAN
MFSCLCPKGQCAHVFVKKQTT